MCTMTYAQRMGHPSDFEVHYRFLTPDEGGLRQLPRQGYCCDWSYEGDDTCKTGLFMIWPEFLAEDGSILPSGHQVAAEGTAGMWILSHDFRVQVHRLRIREGVRGYFMEGSRRMAEAV